MIARGRRFGPLAAGMTTVILAVAAVTLWRSGRVEAPDHATPAGNAPTSFPRQPDPSSRATRPPATQGALAVRLAEGIGASTGLTEDRAIGLLSARGIAPDQGWMAGAPTTEATISQIQKTFHVLLTDLARDLHIPVPPTLNLQIFEQPGGEGQRLHGNPREMALLLPGGGNVDPRALARGQSASVSIAAPSPYPVGDERLPTTWSYRLRHPGAQFIELHFDRLGLSAPSYIRVLDKYGQERWRHIGGDSREADVVASAVPGDTAIIVLHTGAVAAGAGLHIDRYRFGPPVTVTASK